MEPLPRKEWKNWVNPRIIKEVRNGPFPNKDREVLTTWPQLKEVPIRKKGGIIPKEIKRNFLNTRIMETVAEKRLPQDGRFDISDRDGESMDVRVSTFPTVYGEKVVMRLLEQEALKPSLEDLNMNIEDLELFRDSINSPYGLILIHWSNR